MNQTTDPQQNAGTGGRVGPIGLRIPEPDRPAALQELTAGLSEILSAAPERAVPELAELLAAANRQRLDPETRGDWLEQLRPEVQRLVDVQEQSAPGIPACSPFDATARLLAALSDGCKLVAEELAARPKAAPLPLAAALQRSLTTLGWRLLHCFRHYSQPPADLWREIHLLFRFATRNGLESVLVADPLAPVSPCRLEQCYSRLLLLSLANPFSLPQATLAELERRTWSWAEMVRISAGPDGASRFQVDLDQDAPPLPRETGGGSGPERRLVDTSALLEELVTVLGRPAEPSAKGLSGTLVRHLIQVWGEPSSAAARRHPRTDRTVAVELVLGIEALHALLTPRGSVLVRPPPSHSCRTLDTSLSGYRLAWESPAADLQPGQPVGLGLPQGNERRWLVGVVRWIQRQAGQSGFTLGVQLLAAHGESASVRMTDDGETVTRCLVLPALPAIGLQRTLLLPGGDFRPGSELLLETGDSREHIRLQELASASDSYSQYHFLSSGVREFTL